jgi:hypothetical protein
VLDLEPNAEPRIGLISRRPLSPAPVPRVVDFDADRHHRVSQRVPSACPTLERVAGRKAALAFWPHA